MNGFRARTCHALGNLGPFDDDPLSIGLDPELVLHRMISRTAAQTPNRTFLIESNGRTVTYGEFEQEVARWVTLLRERGVTRGSRVATLLPPSISAHAVW